MLLKKSQHIKKTGSAILSILLILFLWNDTSSKDMVKFGHNFLVDPSSYVLEKLKISDVVLLGTKHRQKDILDFISGILPRLHEAGVSHIGLEIASDQQPYIDHYMESGIGTNDIRLHHSIDCPEYRDLLKAIRKSGQKNVLKPVALDLPPSLYESRWNRDEYMAKTICNVFDKNPDAKLLVIVGNLHALKKIAWDDNVPNRYGVIRSYLSEYAPNLEVFSICQCITDIPNQNDLSDDFTMNIMKAAFDCTDRFSNYKMDILETVAAKQMESYEIADGVVMYWI
jgi:hypothetical protein